MTRKPRLRTCARRCSTCPETPFAGTYSPGGRDYYVHDLVVAARSFWLLATDGQVLRVDGATLHPVGLIPALGSCGMACTQMYNAQGSLWVPTSKALFRIDPARIAG